MFKLLAKIAEMEKEKINLVEARKEVASLKEERDIMFTAQVQSQPFYYNEWKKAQSQLASKDAKLGKAITCLDFYANADEDDGGEQARETLKEIESGIAAPENK